MNRRTSPVIRLAEIAALVILMCLPAQADDGRWVHLSKPLSDGTTIWINLDSVGAVPVGTIYDMEIRHTSDRAAPEGSYRNIATGGLVNCQNATVYLRSEAEMGGNFYDQNGHLVFARAVPVGGHWQQPASGSPEAEVLGLVCAEQNRKHSGQPAQPVNNGRVAAANPQAHFQRLYYTPTTGKAGYHIVSKVQAALDDMPGGQACGPFSTSGDVSVDGTLPPGIERPAQKTYFEGTPQEPGDWEVTVHYPGVHCTQGSDTANYGDRDIKVHFHIDGDAAKSVDQLQ